MCGFGHIDRKCGDASILLFGNSMQFGFGWVWTKRCVFGDFSNVGHIGILLFV